MTSQNLHAICDLITDGTHYTPPPVQDGIPFLTVKDMVSGRLDFENSSRMSHDDYIACVKGNCAPQSGDVLFSKDGTVGKVHIVTDESAFGVLSSIAILRPNKKLLDSRYLAHALRSRAVLSQALNRKTGSAIRRIILKDLRDLKISVPSLAEQKRIALILDKATRAITSREYSIGRLDVLTESIFLEMFGDPTKNNKSWDEAYLVDVCKDVFDCPHSTPKYSDSPTQFPCIRSSDIQEGRLVFESTKYVDEHEYLTRIRRYKPGSGDVIYCREGARFGNAAAIPENCTPCLGQRTMVLVPDEKVTNGQFLSRILNSKAVYQQAQNLVIGSASPHVNVGEIKRFKFMLPPIELQTEFALKVSVIEHARAQGIRQLMLLNQLFAALEQSAFSGDKSGPIHAQLIPA